MKLRPIIVLSFVILFIVFTTVQTGYAALKDERIVDGGDFFTAEEEQRLHELFDNQSIDFFLETIPGLNGRKIADYADDALKPLPTESVLILLAEEEREVYIWTVSEKIDEALVAHAGENPYEKIIESTFIPLAQEGDFIGGIEAVVKEVGEAVDEAASAPAPSPATTEERAVAADPEYHPAEAVLALMILTFPIWVVVGYQWYRIAKERRRFQQLCDEWKVFERSLYAPFNEVDDRVRLSKGKTAETWIEIRDRLGSLIEETKAYRGTLHYPIRPFKGKQINQMLMDIHFRVEEAKEDLADLESKINDLRETEKAVTADLQHERDRLDSVYKHLVSWQTEKGWPLSQLESRYEEAKTRLEQAESFDHSLDYLSAARNTEEAREQINQLLKETDTIKEREEAVDLLDETLRKSRSQVEEQVKRERLLLVDANPYEPLQSAESLISNIRQLFIQGDVAGFKKQYTAFLQLLENGQQEVDQLVKLRDETIKEVEKIRSSLPGQDKLDPSFHEQLDRLQQRFTASHWEDLPDRFERVKRASLQIEEQLFQVEGDLAHEVQQYHRAGNRMAEIKQLHRQVEQDYRDCFGRYDHLQEQSTRIQKTVRQAAEQVDRLIQKMNEERLSVESITHTMERIQEQLRFIESRWSQSPLDLNDLEHVEEQVRQDIDHVRQEVEKRLQQKKQVTADLNKLQQHFRNTERKLSGSFTANSYRRDFQRLVETVQTSMNRGLFDQAESDIRIGYDTIREMEREYRETQRQQQHHQPYTGGHHIRSGVSASLRNLSSGGGIASNKSKGGGLHRGGASKRSGSGKSAKPKGGGSSWGGSSKRSSSGRSSKPKGGGAKW
ncbi:septation ring formation regulator EzrA [Desmospora profundinema]|uniref:Membrane protein YgcG/septation ring formation regulator EzrA n=1 Tax=Desmospora profundinema TaxID=1571184 RepID=A0ABU1IHU2_9BACL|nr:septation ring formation regulator EzrA [Desmospora profundinema]MDR6224340.1 putative membrane protein YgcG/septation ring formation regulator EzrA [Desmospora profundinema]